MGGFGPWVCSIKTRPKPRWELSSLRETLWSIRHYTAQVSARTYFQIYLSILGCAITDQSFWSARLGHHKHRSVCKCRPPGSSSWKFRHINPNDLRWMVIVWSCLVCPGRRVRILPRPFLPAISASHFCQPFLPAIPAGKTSLLQFMLRITFI